MIGWELVILVPGLRREEPSGASQRWAGHDWPADYWDRGKQPRFWTLLIIVQTVVFPQ